MFNSVNSVMWIFNFVMNRLDKISEKALVKIDKAQDKYTEITKKTDAKIVAINANAMIAKDKIRTKKVAIEAERADAIKFARNMRKSLLGDG